MIIRFLKKATEVGLAVSPHLLLKIGHFDYSCHNLSGLGFIMLNSVFVVQTPL